MAAEQKSRLTGISHRNRRRIEVAEISSDRGHDGHGDGPGGADDDGPEESRALASSPAAVLEGGGPEDGRRHVRQFETWV